jgi:hypothetical protein
MTNHVQTLKNKLGKIQAMVHTLNTGSNSRSVAMTRGEIMNDNFARAGHTAEAATIMNKAQRLIHG